MAASKPILGVLESGSEVRCLIEDTHGGLCCEPGEYDKVEKNIDGLCAIVEDQLHMDPRRSALYLFCGKRCDRIKALLWESDGFVLLYKRMEVQGRFRWPRNQLEVKQLTWQQFDWLMSGLEIEQPKAFKPTE